MKYFEPLLEAVAYAAFLVVFMGGVWYGSVATEWVRARWRMRSFDAEVYTLADRRADGPEAA